jgi:hypothetical protein
MTKPGTNGTTVAGVFFPPSPCPPDAPCTSATDGQSKSSSRATYQRGKLAPELWENSEAATIIQAVTKADTTLVDAQPQIDAALDVLADRAAEAEGLLHALASFTSSRQLADAHAAKRRVIDRHAEDGPEDRRHRPRWVRWLAWPTVLAAAAYDTWFFAAVFRVLLDASDKPSDIGFWLSLLPGVMLTIALLVSAYWIAQAAQRANDLIERRLERSRWWSRAIGKLTGRPPKITTRTADNLPWPRWWRGGLFGAFTIGTLALWAVIRGGNALQQQLDPSAPPAQTPPLSVALLLLLFSVAAIAIKILDHNPFADTDQKASADLARAQEQHTTLVGSTRTALAAQGKAKAHAEGLVDGLAERAHRSLDEAFAAIMRERAGHGLAGDEAPPFATRLRSGVLDRVALFTNLPEPPINLGPIRRARNQLAIYDLAAARQIVDRLENELTDQISSAGTPPVAEPPQATPMA